MGTFVPRLLALTVVWLLATAALTYAAAQRIGTTPPAATTTAASAPSAPKTLVVPDVRRQAYTFAKGTLGDSGFGWRVDGSVKGFAANTVVTQTPAPGTHVLDTGAPLVVLHLARSGKELGVPDERSPWAATAVRLADLTLATTTPPVVKAPVAKAPVVKTPLKVAPKALKKITPVKKTIAPARHNAPSKRPPAFVVANARREPLDEIPLTVRANLLLRWVNGHPSPTDANVKHWLYQHAWIVSGAELGWWHGTAALQTLVTVDGRVWNLWGIGDRSKAEARRALAEVEARSS
jgi:hypothetical protein